MKKASQFFLKNPSFDSFRRTPMIKFGRKQVQEVKPKPEPETQQETKQANQRQQLTLGPMQIEKDFNPMLGRVAATLEEASWINGEAMNLEWQNVKAISLK